MRIFPPHVNYASNYHADNTDMTLNKRNWNSDTKEDSKTSLVQQDEMRPEGTWEWNYDSSYKFL